MGDIFKNMMKRNTEDSYIKSMEGRAKAKGKEEGKFTDQVAARNTGTSYIKGMEERAKAQGKTEGKFVDEVAANVVKQRVEYDAGGGRSGDNIREHMTTVRNHRVTIDPTVMVALMSMLVLEGWQIRLDPAVSVIRELEQASKGGIFGYASRVGDAIQNVKGWLQGK